MNKTLKRFGAAVLAAAMMFSSLGHIPNVQAGEGLETYEIYPTPHEIEYDAGSWELSAEANVVLESGIDEATEVRLDEVLGLKEMAAAEAEAAANGKTNILVGIYGSGEYVDGYVADNYEVSADLFEKTDAYFLTSDDNNLVVLGATADAAFYGLTTLYHVFAQMESMEILNFEISDWADVVSRGFIEGYYGNPWSVEDRAELMKWGGYYKLNSYFYAPKDDPKHNSNWRELYTEEELETLIKPLAEAGNESKCRFVFALHPFMHNAVNFSSEERYQADLAIVQAKFEQVIEAGVRQIAILADDAGHVGNNNYIKFLTDMCDWLAEMKETYPDLKQTLPFCTQEYMGNGQSYYAQFPENVQIVMTGGRVWGEVSNSFTTTFTANAGRGPYMWVNWPCTDNSKSHLIMGGYSTFLHPGVDPSKIQGIVLNPMQQSEPSKVAIFGNATYSWNIWETEEEADLAWENSFKYVDHNSAIETAASEALREISRHMMNQNMDSRVTPLQESENIKDALSAFRTALDAGTVTKDDCDAIIEIFETLKEAAAIYAESGNERIKGQIIYWLNCWADTTDAAIAYLNAIKANIDGNDNDVVANYNEGKIAFASSKTYGFHYVDHTEYAEVGVQHIVPFINALASYVTGQAELILNPDAILRTYITSRQDAPGSGSVDAIFDGSDASGAIYKNPSYIYEGDYVGVKYSKVIDIKDARFVLGAGKDHFDQAKVQYTMDGSEWIDLNDTIYEGVRNQVQEVALTEEDLGADFQAMGLRLIATADNAADAWLEVREIAINETVVTEDEESDVNYKVIKSSEWVVYSGSEASLYDGDDSTYVWYNPTSGASADEFYGYDFGKVIKLQSIHSVHGNDGADKFLSYAIETSVDGESWTNRKTVTGATSGQDIVDIELNGVEARYLRVRNTETVEKWIKISELTVKEVEEASSKYVYTNITTDVVSDISEDTITLTGGTVTLGKDEYIGIELANIKNVLSIGGSELADGLKIQTSKNEILWEDYTDGAVDARFIRVINTTDADVTWTFENFSATYYVVGEYAIEAATFANGDSSRDMRSKGNVADVFDGDLSTLGEMTGVQGAGKYVIFDLGRNVDFDTIRYYITESHMDYPRSMVLEVADSPEAEEWATVLTVKKEGFENVSDTTTAKSMQDNGLYHDNSNPGYMYAEATDLDVSGRYLRARIVDAYDYRWLAFNEIQINGGEYLSMEDGRDIVSDSVEQPYQIPSNALDLDFSTSYVPAEENSSFTYYLSEPQDVKSLRFVQFGEASNAEVTAVYADGTEEYLGMLLQCINDFNLAEGKTLVSVTVEWAAQTPEIAEIMTFDKLAENPIDPDQKPEEKPDPVEVDKKALEAVIAEAKAVRSELSGDGVDVAILDEIIAVAEHVLADENATQDEVDGTVESVTAILEELRGSGSVELEFVDVTEADYFYNAVVWAVENDVTAGITPTTFEPYTGCNRAQIVLFLYRALNGEASDAENPFVDVSEADYCYDAVLWAVENGITTGITATTFEPWKECSRAEIVTFLWRAMGSEKVATDTAFPDVNEADFFYDAVAWAVENGITQGRNDGTFGAWLGCWRCDAVTFLQRAFSN